MAAGVDPSEKAKVDRAAREVATANTFGVIADELIAKMGHEHKAIRTIAKVTWLFSITRPDLGQRPINAFACGR